MININFAPNETFSDAWLSFTLLFQPWRWMKGKEIETVKTKILKQILNVSRYTPALNRIYSGSGLHVSLFFTGRSALYNLLKSLNLKPGDEILVQAFTCEAVVLPIIALNLKPVYVDIENQSFSMNPIDLEKKLSKKAKVLILQHTFGITPTHRGTILSLIKKHNLVLIEDIAHGIKISKIKNQISKINNHFYLLSFGRSKSLSSVFGGAIVSKNNRIAKKLKKIQLGYPSYSTIFKLLLYKPIVYLVKLTYNIYLGKIIHFLAKKLNLLTFEISQKEKRGQFDLFFNKAYPNALAILLLNQLKRFQSIQKQRIKIVEYYHQNLKIYCHPELDSGSPLIRYPLLVNNPSLILKKMAKFGIFLGNWYNQPVAPKDLPLDRVGYKLGSCPVAEKTCDHIVNLPTNISIKQAKRIIKLLKNIV
jgi:dTDP-4-amino-4,6-dideoxygalactose transaminase